VRRDLLNRIAHAYMIEIDFNKLGKAFSVCKGIIVIYSRFLLMAQKIVNRITNIAPSTAERQSVRVCFEWNSLTGLLSVK
jgi:hypothetical protein